jgi:nucleoside-diphosphate-sugar epimerase
MLEFAAQIRRITRTTGEIVFQPLPEDDPRQRKPDIAKARHLLSWQPRVPLAEGLRPTVKYFSGILGCLSPDLTESLLATH